MKHKEFMDFLESKRNHWLKISYQHGEEYVLIQKINADYNQAFEDYEYTISGPGIFLHYNKNIKSFMLNSKHRVYSSKQYEIFNPIEFKKIYDEKFNRELLCHEEWEGNKTMRNLDSYIKNIKEIITNIQKAIVELKREVRLFDKFSAYVEIKQKRKSLKMHENNLRLMKQHKKRCNQLYGAGWPSLSKCRDMNSIERMNRENWEFSNKMKNGNI